MDHLTQDVNGYLILALQEANKLYGTALDPNPDNPSQKIAELETIINAAIDKVAHLTE